MGKKKILVVQNAACETLGTLQTLFEEDGFTTDTIIASRGELLPGTLDGYGALVVLGGPAGANDEHGYLRDEEQLISGALEKRMPTLGICLGSQLLAKAAGARVYRGPRKEIGWHSVTLTDEGMGGIFKGLEKNELTVFQWHGDTYDLPPNAVALARSELYPVQAFRAGRAAYGIQFHLEVSKDMIMDWLNQYRTELQSVRDHTGVEKITERLDSRAGELGAHARSLYRNFSGLIVE